MSHAKQASAFPHEAQPHHQPETSTMGSPQGGLTKRELFAAMAMQGFAAYYGACGPHNSGEMAVKWADALIAALSDEEVSHG